MSRAPCPKCGAETRVQNSRPTAHGILRRRKCDECGHRHSTLEILYEGHERAREVARWASEHNRELLSMEEQGE